MGKMKASILAIICIIFAITIFMKNNDKIYKSFGVTVKSSEENTDKPKEDIKKEEQIIIEDEQPEQIEEENVEITTENNIESSDDSIEQEVEYITISPEDVRIPILMYHSISNDDPNNTLLIPVDMFNEQMTWLKENGFTAMSMDDVIEAMSTGKVPKKPVAITFDDGYADNYNNAFPILKNNNMMGTFFIITDKTDNDGWYMSSDMLKEMKEAGMKIENHTSNHLELNTLSREEQIESIKTAQDSLREVIGVESKFLCYPVGRYDYTTIEVSQELGIKAAVTTEHGISSINNGVYELNRVRIAPMSIESFAELFLEYN